MKSGLGAVIHSVWLGHYVLGKTRRIDSFMENWDIPFGNGSNTGVYNSTEYTTEY